LENRRKQFRLAAKKSGEAAQKEPREKFKPFFATKAQGYEFCAQARAINQEIPGWFWMKSIVKGDELIAKAEAAGKRRDAIQKSGDEAEAKPNAIAKEAKDNPQ